MKYVVPILVALIVLLVGPHVYTNWRMDNQIRDEISASVEAFDAAGHAGANRTGHVKVEGVRRVLKERYVRFLLKKEGQPASYVYFWDWGGVKSATASAMGLDRKHHFANSYLVGFQPFETKRIWVPLYALVLRKRYQYDHIQYSGLQDVWQNSRQAYYYTRGDCEDHAVILADWLIQMGLDARVVLGRYKERGHAWVVLFHTGNVYLLEATSKRKVRNLGAMPAAGLMVDYSPEYQFNRESFWVNTGTRFTTKYSGSHWILKSRFVTAGGGAS